MVKGKRKNKNSTGKTTLGILIVFLLAGLLGGGLLLSSYPPTIPVSPTQLPPGQTMSGKALQMIGYRPPTSTPTPTIMPPTPAPTFSTTPSSQPVIPTPSGNPIPLNGLHVSGNKLVDSQGKQVILRGVNRSGAEYSCVHGSGVFDGPSDAASVQAIASWKANVIRVPMNEDCWLGINGVGNGGTSYQQAISAYVSTITQLGLYVILDLHWSAPGGTLANKQAVMADMDHSVAFWNGVAQMFKGNPMVIFDLFNEPQHISWICWKNGGSACPGSPFQFAGMQTLVNTVRSTGATNILMLGGPSYASDVSGWQANKPSDPINNVAVSWHIYGGPGICTTQACLDRGASLSTQAPIIAGEFGESFDSSICGTTNDQNIVSWLDNHQASYLAWTWDTWGTSCSNLSLVTNYSGTPKAPNGLWYKSYLAKF